MHCVDIERINLRSVNFFKRALNLRISKDSIGFFEQYQDSFFQEILDSYMNVSKVIINMNWLFDINVIDKFFEKFTNFALNKYTKTLLIEDCVLEQHTIDLVMRRNFSSNLQALQLPRNNLRNEGILLIFESSRLAHILEIDLSSNQISEKGAQYIANSKNYAKLKTLSISNNSVGNSGIEAILKSENYPNLCNFKADLNKISSAGVDNYTKE